MDRVGERKLMICGEWAEITAYRNSKDIDLRFDSGEVRTHMSYWQFRSGRISKIPCCDTGKLHIGEHRMMRSGIGCTVTAWRSVQDIDVSFDDGSVKEHVSYSNFKKGGIIGPNQSVVKYSEGYKKRSNNGLMMEVVERLPKNRLLVRFENGEEKVTTITSFADGSVASDKARKEEIYRKTVANFQGLTMRIKEYRGTKDVDVVFDDGTVIKHRTFDMFNRGKVRNPNWNACIGKTFTARNGLTYVPIRCHGYNTKIEVVFEDGEHAFASAGEVREGIVRHPHLSPRYTGDFFGYITTFAYRDGKDVYYKAMDKKTGEKFILTPHMMMKNRKYEEAPAG